MFCFACITAFSLGFHVFPSFVVSELAIFIPITTLCIIAKVSWILFVAFVISLPAIRNIRNL